MCLTVRLNGRVADVIRHRQAVTVIAALLDPAPQVAQRCRLLIKRHRGGLRNRVRINPDNARPSGQDTLDHELFVREIESRYIQDRRRQTAVAGDLPHAERLASMNDSGLRSNVLAHPGPQKEYVLSSNSRFAGADAMSTVI